MVGFYDMMERNPLTADLLLEILQPGDKRIMLQFVGRVAGIPVQALDTLLVTEVFDHIPIQKTEQGFQFINPVAGLAGFQKLIKV